VCQDGCLAITAYSLCNSVDLTTAEVIEPFSESRLGLGLRPLFLPFETVGGAVSGDPPGPLAHFSAYDTHQSRIALRTFEQIREPVTMPRDGMAPWESRLTSPQEPGLRVGSGSCRICGEGAASSRERPSRNVWRRIPARPVCPLSRPCCGDGAVPWSWSSVERDGAWKSRPEGESSRAEISSHRGDPAPPRPDDPAR